MKISHSRSKMLLPVSLISSLWGYRSAGECLTGSQEVTGSNPVISIYNKTYSKTYSKRLHSCSLFCLKINILTLLKISSFNLELFRFHSHAIGNILNRCGNRAASLCHSINFHIFTARMRIFHSRTYRNDLQFLTP